jgi:hypothetical protein
MPLNRRNLLLSSLLGLALTACQTEAPIRMASSLRVTPELLAEKPADIAILPIEDGTVAKTFGSLEGRLRAALVKQLAQRTYSPLDPLHIDRRLRDTGRLATGSPTAPTWIDGLRGTFEEDAILGLRITGWDVSRIMETRRVDFAAELLMVSSKTGAPLWTGRVEGSVKAGGTGPAPLGREQRVESAADVVAEALAAELPRRAGG